MSVDVEFRVAFQVHGLPIAQGSKTPWGAESAKGLPSWRQDIASVAGQAMDREPVSDPVVVYVDFKFPRPKHHYGTGRNAALLKSGVPIWVNKKPDLDKLLRALGDAITGIVIRDDSQIVASYATKMYGTHPGVAVRIELAP